MPDDEARTRTESRLIEQKEIYRQILDAIADMVLVKGAHSRILWANKAFCDYYGMTNAQLRDIVDAPFNEPDYTLSYIRDDTHVYTTGRVLDIPEEPVTRHDGLEQIFHTVKSPLRDADGVVRMTVGVSRNITEQKRTQAELARYRHRLEDLVEARTRELADLSDRLQIILASLAEGIVAVDGHGTVQLMNAAAEALTGWPEQEARGRPRDELIAFEPDARVAAGAAGVADAWRNVRRLTGTLRSRGGERRIVSLATSALESKDGVTHGSLLVIRDIALERELEDQRLRQQKLESVGLLAGGIAHDFNNSLMGILGSLNVARLQLEQGHDPSAVLARAEDACLRARSLTTQLLAFAKGGSPVKRVVQLGPVVRDAAELALHGAPVTLAFSCAAELDATEADEGQIAQAVTNLVQNARQACPRDNQVRVSVHTETLAEGDVPPLPCGRYAVIEVQDCGVGIAARDLPRIFDPYFTTRAEGNGLGLASVEAIVRRHGGHTTVSSLEGHGSCFRVYLPSVPTREDEGAAAPACDFSGRRRKLLILDDDLVVREALCGMLAGLGHEVVATATSADAFAACEAALLAGTPFEMACVDLTMPGDLDGATVIARLRERQPGLGMIVMSGYSVEPVMAQHQELNLLGALQKPFSLHALQEAINRRSPDGDGDAHRAAASSLHDEPRGDETS